MYREIIKAKSEEYLIKIPKNYLNKEIEILILPLFTNYEPESEPINDYLSKLLLSGPTLSDEEIVSWQNQITEGYKNWKIEEF